MLKEQINRLTQSQARSHLPRMDSVNVKIALVSSLNRLSSFTMPTAGLPPSGIVVECTPIVT